MVIVGLLFCSAFISGAEVAYFSLSPKDKEELNSSKSKLNTLIQDLLATPKKLLATILIANNFVNISIVILSSYLSNSLFSFENSWFGLPPEVLEFIGLVGLVTFLILLVGEVIPKVYANKYPLKLAGVMAYPIYALGQVFWYIGLSRFLIFTTSFIDKKFIKKSENISVDQLSHALDLTSDSEVSKDEQKILEGIVKFGKTDVKQIMQPRTEVTSINIASDYKLVMQEILNSGYSRIPIYKEDFDHIEGVLYIKDLLSHLNEEDNFNWQTLIRNAYFVPESKKIDDLLTEFQAKKIHLAIVVDEYGGNSGIITLEDIIEEIVGDITDEFDNEEVVYSKLDDTNYVFEGKIPLKDLYRVLDIGGDNFENNKGDSDTLAGFILELSGKIMQKNEKVNFENYSFTIEASDRRRIKRVKVTINESKIEEAEK
ncbi:MAG: gliding motility-associated protein GldE [Flavobacteriales bacterium]|nr:gliding motility-associated protein GldE [Flavobacteriales bacterium]